MLKHRKLELVSKTDLPLAEQQRLIRIQLDVYLLRLLTDVQLQSVYSELENARDTISSILDRLDGKNV